MLTVFAFPAGKIAAKAPVISDSRTCNKMVVFEISNTGNNVPVTVRNISAEGNVNAIPVVPPNNANKQDSKVTNPIKKNLPNPIDLRVAYSHTRSRAVMIIVLAITSIIIIITT